MLNTFNVFKFLRVCVITVILSCSPVVLGHSYYGTVASANSSGAFPHGVVSSVQYCMLSAALYYYWFCRELLVVEFVRSPDA